MSIWYGVDPLAVYNSVMENQFYGVGQHNGGAYNIGNLNPYIYTYQNPSKYIDSNVKQVESFTTDDGVKNLVIINYGYDGINRQRGQTQNIGKDDGLANIHSTGSSLRVVNYASSSINSTKEDSKRTITNFQKAHPKGQVILIGTVEVLIIM